MNVGSLLLSLLVSAAIIGGAVWVFLRLLSGYRVEIASLKSSDLADTRLAHVVAVDKRLSRAKWFIGIGYLASFVWLFFSAFSSGQRDAATTISALVLPVALVGINVGLPMAVRAPYAKGQTPSWRRVAMFTLVLWATFLVSVSGFASALGLTVFALAPALLTLPTLLWFPVWLLVAVSKQRKMKNPE